MSELYHFGVKGMKWGIRRYQNEDGTLTDAGKKKLETYKTKEATYLKKQYDRNSKINSAYESRQVSRLQKLKDKGYTSDGQKLQNAQKKVDLAKKATKYEKDNFDAQMNAIGKMTYKQMQTENKAVHKQIALNVLGVIGAVGAATAMAQLTGFGFAMAPIDDAHSVRAKARTKTEAYRSTMTSRGYNQSDPRHKGK